MLEGLWLVHPDDAMCEAFRAAVRRAAERPRRPGPVRGSGAARLLRHRRQRLRADDRRDRRRRRPPVRRGAHAAGPAPDHGRVLRRAAGRHRVHPPDRRPVAAVPVPTPRRCGCRATSRAPTRCTRRPGRRCWRSRPTTGRRPSKIEVVAFPAMGTGFGGVPFDEAARQMAAAYRHLLEPPHRLDWDFVAERHKADLLRRRAAGGPIAEHAEASPSRTVTTTTAPPLM